MSHSIGTHMSMYVTPRRPRTPCSHTIHTNVLCNPREGAQIGVAGRRRRRVVRRTPRREDAHAAATMFTLSAKATIGATRIAPPRHARAAPKNAVVRGTSDAMRCDATATATATATARADDSRARATRDAWIRIRARGLGVTRELAPRFAFAMRNAWASRGARREDDGRWGVGLVTLKPSAVD